MELLQTICIYTVVLVGLGCKEKGVLNSKLPKRTGHIGDNPFDGRI
ncbi:golgi reassembly-stacking protein 2 [Trichinella spiralis]|nr:golgi reassembly-stacking protein 2 [Trichinella spiralis]